MAHRAKRNASRQLTRSTSGRLALRVWRKARRAAAARGRDMRISELKLNTARLHRMLVDLTPDTLPCSPGLRQQLASLLGEHGLPTDINLAVSKNDLMFHFLYAAMDYHDAYLEYIASGIQQLELLKSVVSLEGCRVLDFASGYGRLTRLLVTQLPPSQVWVSDIKAGAIAFQRAEFGVEGFLSATDPNDLRSPTSFDVIFVGSLFSHLPAQAFERWLEWAWNALTERGTLIFTTHPIELVPERERPGGDHVFHEQNEESVAETDASPLPVGDYGTMYVDGAFVNAALAKATHNSGIVERIPRGWLTQDVYVVRHPPITRAGVGADE
jgi:SAM-dependent methyltransferase